MISALLLSWASVGPMERTACSVPLDKQESNVSAFYVCLSATETVVSIVDSDRKMFHFFSHISKFLNSSRSNAGLGWSLLWIFF